MDDGFAIKADLSSKKAPYGKEKTVNIQEVIQQATLIGEKEKFRVYERRGALLIHIPFGDKAGFVMIDSLLGHTETDCKVALKFHSKDRFSIWERNHRHGTYDWIVIVPGERRYKQLKFFIMARLGLKNL